MTWRTGSPSWWNEWTPLLAGYQWPHRDFMLTLRGAADTRVVFISLQDDPPEKSLQIALGTSHGYHTSNTLHVVQQKRGSVLLMDGTFIHRRAGGPGRTIFVPFVPERFRTPPNVVEPENVPDVMFVEPEEPEVAEAEEDPPATSLGSDLQPPALPAPRLSWSAPLKTPSGMEKKIPYMGDVWVNGTWLGPLPLACAHSRRRDWGHRTSMPSSARCPGTIAGGSSLPWRTTWFGSPSPPAASTFGSVLAASSSPAHPAPVRCSGLQRRCTIPPQCPACKPSLTAK